MLAALHLSNHRFPGLPPPAAGPPAHGIAHEVIRHYTGHIVSPNTEQHLARVLATILQASTEAVASGCLEGLIIGVDVEYAPGRRGQVAAVMQIAVEGFVLIIPLKVLTRPAACKPVSKRALTVCPLLWRARLYSVFVWRHLPASPVELTDTTYDPQHNTGDMLQLLKALLTSDAIRKCGVGINNDMRSLERFYASLSSPSLGSLKLNIEAR